MGVTEGAAEVWWVGGGVDGMAVFLFLRHLIPWCNVDTIMKRKGVPELPPGWKREEWLLPPSASNAPFSLHLTPHFLDLSPFLACPLLLFLPAFSLSYLLHPHDSHPKSSIFISFICFGSDAHKYSSLQYLLIMWFLHACPRLHAHHMLIFHVHLHQQQLFLFTVHGFIVSFLICCFLILN